MVKEKRYITRPPA